MTVAVNYTIVLRSNNLPILRLTKRIIAASFSRMNESIPADFIVSRGLQAKHTVRRSMFTRNKKIAVGSVLVCLIVLLSPFVLTGEYVRVSGPDGRFYAVATFPIWQRYVPLMPGQSGDRSGSVTVYTADGRSCGRVPVDMVSFIRDLEWKPGRAEIRLVAAWDLSKRQASRLQ